MDAIIRDRDGWPIQPLNLYQRSDLLPEWRVVKRSDSNAPVQMSRSKPHAKQQLARYSEYHSYRTYVREAGQPMRYETHPGFETVWGWSILGMDAPGGAG